MVSGWQWKLRVRHLDTMRLVRPKSISPLLVLTFAILIACASPKSVPVRPNPLRTVLRMTAVCTKAVTVDTAHARSSLPAIELDGHLTCILTADIMTLAVKLSHANTTTI
jgi:hypothetical protein